MRSKRRIQCDVSLVAIPGCQALAARSAPQPGPSLRIFRRVRRGDQALTLKGNSFQKWEMINPHSWFHIDVKGPDGQVTEWMIEGGSPNTLIRLGVTKYTVKIGTELTIEGYQAKEATNKAVGRNFVLPDGTRLFLSLGSALVSRRGSMPGNEVEAPKGAVSDRPHSSPQLINHRTHRVQPGESYSYWGRGAGAGLASFAASIGTFSCTSLSSVVACPFVQVVVQRNGILTPDTSR